MASTPAWLALLAPLPAEAKPRRRPVASPEVLRTEAGAAIAGWTELILELTAGPAGMRVVLVVCDAQGRPIGASDMVYHRSAGTPVELRQESLGGRLELDGTFRGTRWRSVALEPVQGSAAQWESTPSEPGPDDVAGLRALVADLLRRDRAG